MRLRLIRPCEFQLAQVFGVDASHVIAREARIVEVLEVFVAFGHGLDEVGQVLIDRPVGADGVADFLGVEATAETGAARGGADDAAAGVAAAAAAFVGVACFAEAAAGALVAAAGVGAPPPAAALVANACCAAATAMIALAWFTSNTFCPVASAS